MIQRVQSVYLILAALLTIIAMFLPWVIYTVDNAEIYSSVMQMGDENTNSALLGINLGAALALTLVALFKFKNRPTQMKLVLLASAVSFITFFVFGYSHYNNIQDFLAQGELNMNYQVVITFPYINLVFYWLAYRGIKKDHDLVKSVDRLR